jgi:hypothetical protein
MGVGGKLSLGNKGGRGGSVSRRRVFPQQQQLNARFNGDDGRSSSADPKDSVGRGALGGVGQRMPQYKRQVHQQAARMLPRDVAAGGAHGGGKSSSVVKVVARINPNAGRSSATSSGAISANVLGERSLFATAALASTKTNTGSDNTAVGAVKQYRRTTEDIQASQRSFSDIVAAALCGTGPGVRNSTGEGSANANGILLNPNARRAEETPEGGQSQQQRRRTNNRPTSGGSHTSSMRGNNTKHFRSLFERNPGPTGSPRDRRGGNDAEEDRVSAKDVVGTHTDVGANQADRHASKLLTQMADKGGTRGLPQRTGNSSSTEQALYGPMRGFVASSAMKQKMKGFAYKSQGLTATGNGIIQKPNKQRSSQGSARRSSFGASSAAYGVVQNPYPPANQTS